MTKDRKNRLNRSIGGNLVTFSLIVILGIFMLAPMIYVVGNAFKPIEELYRFPPTLFVQNPTTKNFTNMFNLLNETTMPFMRYFFNTLLQTTVASVGQIVMASLCAYSLAKIPFPGSNVIFKIVVLSLMFSGTVTSVPTYIIYVKLGLIDTYAGMLLPTLVNTMGFYLMKQFMHTNVPNELLEAARIDGASELNIFFKIVMPLLKPAWYTLIILSIQNLWGANSAYTYREVFKTLPEALAQISSGGIERTGVSSAASLIMLVVPIGCFVIMQSKIVDTMGSAGLKG